MEPTNPSEPTLPVTDASLQAYYALGKEADRLTDGLGRVEFLRTAELLDRVLPPPPAVVADIGGGPGIYTDHLLALGHHVVHRDLVMSHVEHIRARHRPGTPTGDRLDAAVEDARRLDLDDASVDAVLLLGPLYHLVDPDDRRRAITEAARIVRPGGPIAAAAISRHSVLLDSVLLKRVDRVYPEVLGLLDGVRDTGVIPPLFEGSFNGYAHRPDEFRRELTDAGLQVDDVVSVEGVAVALDDLDQRLDDPDERSRLLFVLRSMESAPDLLGLGPHLLALARTPAA
ncbi:MAG: class I SAM-dependent methyltransferase [Actinomycetota bacterium]